MWDSEDDFVREMLDTGCMKDYYMDTDGEWLCEWNMPKLKEMYPDVYSVLREEMDAEVNETIKGMVEDGILQMGFRENDDGTLEEVYSLTDYGKNIADEMGLKRDES